MLGALRAPARRLRVDGQPRLLRRGRAARVAPAARGVARAAQRGARDRARRRRGSGSRRSTTRGRGATIWSARCAGAPRARPRCSSRTIRSASTQAAEAGAELVLSGHTHGGQIAVPFLAAALSLASLGPPVQRRLLPPRPLDALRAPRPRHDGAADAPRRRARGHDLVCARRRWGVVTAGRERGESWEGPSRVAHSQPTPLRPLRLCGPTPTARLRSIRPTRGGPGARRCGRRRAGRQRGRGCARRAAGSRSRWRRRVVAAAAGAGELEREIEQRRVLAAGTRRWARRRAGTPTPARRPAPRAGRRGGRRGAARAPAAPSTRARGRPRRCPPCVMPRPCDTRSRNVS